MKYLSFIIVVISLLYSCKCSNNEVYAAKYAEYGDNLRDAIDDFESGRKEFSTEMADIVRKTSEELSDEDHDLTDIATNWEVKWNDLVQQYEDIKNDFRQVGAKSDEYFDALYTLVDSINNQEIKQSQIESNTKLRNKWDYNYQHAQNSISKIEELLELGNDYKVVLIVSGLRYKLEEKSKKLNTISQKADEILEELKIFTTKSKKLLN